MRSSKSDSYFSNRIYTQLGIKPDQNKVKIRYNNRYSDFDIFTEDDNGNIDILVFTLDRELILYDHPKANPEKPSIYNDRQQVFKITRLKDPKSFIDPKTSETKQKKYNLPKGAGTYPFLPPGLIDKYENKEKIKSLVLTEGYFKAFKGFMHGLDIIGLSSITHYKNKDTQAMYIDVIRVIKQCQVENVILLYDGDCLDISTKALEKEQDLITRPKGFYNSAKQIRELLKDSEIDVYFSHIISDSIEESPKGLDDILIASKGKENNIVNDLLSLSKPSHFFWKTNITLDIRKLSKHFHFNPVDEFYNFHSDKIGDREFIKDGTKYQYDYENETCSIKIPGAAKFYCRVGDDYYKYVQVPNQYKQLERRLLRRLKGTIELDHGNKLLKHIPKYEAFCNVPDHENYTEVINNCLNIYHEFEHSAEEGSCPVSLKFVRHIFGNHYRLGMDYLQLLYKQPTQILPILALVSSENQTGKTTFIKWLKAIFTQNATIVGNEELTGSFNRIYASKLIIACEESFIEKKTVIEKIKALSTADNIVMNRKGKDHEEINFFGKFIFASNNEDSFIWASENDVRYWIRKIPSPCKDNPNLLQELIDEIPFFLNYLGKRKMKVANQESRMWFHHKRLITDALKKLIDNSKPRIEKDIRMKIKQLFIDFGAENLEISLEWLYDALLKKTYKEIEIKRTLDRMEIERFKNSKGKFDSKEVSLPFYDVEGKPITLKKRCRPYIFYIKKFFTKTELEDYETFNTENNISSTKENYSEKEIDKVSIPQGDLPF